MAAEGNDHFTLWNLGSQQIHVAFDGGRVVSDAGLLAVRALESPCASSPTWPSGSPTPAPPSSSTTPPRPSSPSRSTNSWPAIPTATTPKPCATTRSFRSWPTSSPDAEQPLASGTTLTRFQYAYTRRQAELPPEERPALLEVRAAQTQRLKILNDYLVDLFIRTRTQAPAEVILDIDATDDPIHGRQAL